MSFFSKNLMVADIVIASEYEIIQTIAEAQRKFAARYPVRNRLHFLTLFHLQ